MSLWLMLSSISIPLTTPSVQRTGILAVMGIFASCFDFAILLCCFIVVHPMMTLPFFVVWIDSTGSNCFSMVRVLNFSPKPFRAAGPFPVSVMITGKSARFGWSFWLSSNDILLERWFCCFVLLFDFWLASWLLIGFVLCVRVCVCVCSFVCALVIIKVKHVIDFQPSKAWRPRLWLCLITSYSRI